MSDGADSLYAIIRHVRPLHRRLARTVEEHPEGTGVSVGMRAVLERVDDDGPQTVPQMARSLGLARQFIQRTVDDLLARGLLEKRENAGHKRSPFLALT